MIKLAVCVGFLATFGFAAYAIVLLLTKAFNQDQKKSEDKNNINQTPKKEENGN